MSTRPQNLPESIHTALAIPAGNNGGYQKACLPGQGGKVLTAKEVFLRDGTQGDRNEDDSQECILLVCMCLPRSFVPKLTLDQRLRFISRSVMYSLMRWQVHGMAYIQSRSVPCVWQYFWWLEFKIPDRAPCDPHDEPCETS